MPERYCRRAAVAAALTTLCVAAAADVGRTPNGFWYATGGIGSDESSRFAADSVNHSLSLRLAALGSGEYLADVQVRITDASGREVFRGRLDGPWLLMDLPPGRYEIAGVLDGQVERTSVAVPRHGRRSVVLYFLVAGQTRPFRAEQP